MELTYQGLRIVIPFEGAIGVEAFTLEASFNHHVCVEIILLANEDVIETVIHEIADGDSITVYGGMQEMPLFAGSITDAEMVTGLRKTMQGEKSAIYIMQKTSYYVRKQKMQKNSLPMTDRAV